VQSKEFDDHLLAHNIGNEEDFQEPTEGK